MPAIVDRIDCFASALELLDSSTQQTFHVERLEREALSRLLSQRIAQETSERTRACAKLSEEIVAAAAPAHWRRSPSPVVQSGYSNAQYSSGTSIELHPHDLVPRIEAFHHMPGGSSPPQPPPSENYPSFASPSRSVGRLVPAGVPSLNMSPRSQRQPGGLPPSWGGPGGRGLYPRSPRCLSPNAGASTAALGRGINGNSGLRSSVPVLAGRDATASSVMRSTSQPQAPTGPLDRRSAPVAVIVATSRGEAGSGSPPLMGRPGGPSFDAIRSSDWEGAASMPPQIYKGPVRMSTHGSVVS